MLRNSLPIRSGPLMLLLANVLGLVIGASAATNAPTMPDPAFAAGFAALQQATGFIPQPTSHTQSVWQPNLQLWVGVKAVTGTKQTIYFVQLTTLPPPLTNATGTGWEPARRTNDWAWSPSNKVQFVTPLYPVRARVYDATGRQLKEGQTPMAWGMATNGLFDLCRISREIYGNLTNAPDFRSGAGPSSTAPEPRANAELMCATGGGFLWMFGMLHDLQTVPAVADVWGQAQCAIRWPSAWTLATSLVTGLTIGLEPRVEKVSFAPDNPADPAGPLYLLPVDLTSEKRDLTHAEIVVGPARGAEMLLAGIRSIHAAHPTKPKQEFLAQVLGAGTASPEQP